MEHLHFESTYPVSVETLFAYHEKPRAFERLTPPWTHVEVVYQDPRMDIGKQVVLKLEKGPFKLKWHLEHTEYIPGKLFTDTQLYGPFKQWRHRHHFLSLGESSSKLSDEIEFALPLGFLGNWLALWYVKNDLERLFSYRHQVLGRDLEEIVQNPLNGISLQIEGKGSFLQKRFEAFASVAGANLKPNSSSLIIVFKKDVISVGEHVLQVDSCNEWQAADTICYQIATLLNSLLK